MVPPWCTLHWEIFIPRMGDHRLTARKPKHPTSQGRLAGNVERSEMQIAPPFGGDRRSAECITMTCPRVAQAPL